MVNSGSAIPIEYAAPTLTGGEPGVSVTCTPPSGSMFAIGATQVVCTATDTRQRTDSCSFSVVVQRSARLSLTRFESFGDSITWGEDGRNEAIVTPLDERIRPRVRFAIAQTYPGVLLSSLVSRYATQQIAVANFGEPGESAQDSETLARFDNVTAGGNYDAVLLMEGTNDIFYGNPAQVTPAIGGLRAMVRLAKSRNLRVFLATVPPIVANAPRGLGAALVPALNSEIRLLAQAEDVTLVDVWNAFGINFQQYLGFDGLHPNQDGYAKIADAFFTAIRTTLEVPQSTTPSPTVLRSGSTYLPVRRRP
jgi:lysophospholipase L1-like esterase